jgi:hypothetical protein
LLEVSIAQGKPAPEASGTETKVCARQTSTILE